MGCGMVRKVDELGRVVIPKEMRRILNIKTGSSIEMIINDNNEVVLKKFSELSIVSYFAENIANLIFDEFDIPCLICDDEKVLICKGLSKKEFLDKSIAINEKKITKGLAFDGNIVKEQSCKFAKSYIFPIVSEGVYNSGYIIVVKKEDDILSSEQNKNCFDENALKFISFFAKILSGFLKV